MKLEFQKKIALSSFDKRQKRSGCARADKGTRALCPLIKAGDTAPAAHVTAMSKVKY